MSGTINICNTPNSIAISIADELEAEFTEKIEIDGISLERSSLLIASMDDQSVLMITIVGSTIGSTFGNILGAYAIRFIDSLVKKHENAKSADIEKLKITVLYDANRKGKGNHSFSIPSESSEAKAFFYQPFPST